MSPSIMALTMITTMTLVAGCYGFCENDRTSRFTADAARLFHRSGEGEKTRGQMELCRPTNLRKDRLGRVNVFAFLDPSWHYSYRQAIMLGLLKKRLEKSGFTDILFFVVTPPSNLPEDNRENDVEIKTWKEVSKNILESEYFLDATETMFNDVTKNKQGIMFLQDNPELGIWKSFRVSKDEVVVVNRCGRLTYQVIVPWSILYFPYVKAAILSTYNEDPCGPCEEQISTTHYDVNYDEYVITDVDKGETMINRNLNSYLERTFNDVKTTTISVDESDDKESTNIISPLNLNAYENKIYNTTTTNDVPIDPIKATETMKIEDKTFVSDTSIVIATEVTPEREQSQISTIISVLETTESYEELSDHVPSIKQINTNNENNFLTLNNSNINVETNREDRRTEPDVSLNNMNKGEGADTEQKELQLQDGSLPLRIILYAPHLHEENGTLKKYTHVVLKTGSPDYHDHFHSKITTSNREPSALKKSDSTLLNDKELSEYLHSKNESPGVYGEIADYWRTTDEEELENKNENAEFTYYDYATAEDTESDVNDAFDSKSSILRPNNIDTIESDTNIKTNDEIDEFIRPRLIEHYNKLLTWISYIL